MRAKWLVPVAAPMAAMLFLAACGTAPRKTDDALVAAIGAVRAIPNGVAKTFAGSVGDVRTAVLKSLVRMDARVVFDAESEQGWRIWAVADERMMLIQLQRVSPTATVMRVVIDQSEWDGEGFDIALPTAGPAPVTAPQKA